MIKTELLSLDYYFNKLSTLLKSSHGVKEDINFYVELLKQIDNCLDEMSKALDIFNVNQSEYDFTNADDVLDKLGSLYNVRRQFSVIDNGQTVSLTLTNEELMLLIKSRILQNNYQGTFEEQKQLFLLLGLDILQLTSADNAECDVYLNDTSVSENIQHMFKAGLFTLQSMGISYNYYIQDIMNVAVFDVSNWDEKLWS